MDPEERSLLADAVGGALTGAHDADRALAELGWTDMIADAPRDTVAVVFHALGEHALAATVLDDVVVAALDPARPPTGAAVVLPAYDTTAPPGCVAGGSIAVAGLVLRSDDVPSTLLVPCASGGDVVLAEMAAGSLDVRRVSGIDPDIGLASIHGDAAEAVASTELDREAWSRAVAAAQRALGHQLVGSARRMLTLARDHAVDRVQFGRRIASFQAVRHKLADAYVAIETADSALVAAWDEPGSLTAALAKSISGRAARIAAKHSQQVLAGIGFTAEHELHRHVRRVAVLDGLFGSAASLPRRIGEQLVSERRVPRVIDL